MPKAHELTVAVLLSLMQLLNMAEGTFYKMEFK